MDSILVLVGPSAVGKTTVMTRILELYGEKFEPIRSATTREPRGDSFDSEYIYLSREEFLSSVSRGELLEYMEYGGNLYGTPKSEVERVIRSGKSPLLVLDMVGVESIKSKERPFLTFAVYIYDSLDVLESRLAERYLSDKLDTESYNKRISANVSDYMTLPCRSHLFDLTIRNEDVTDTAKGVVEAFYEAKSEKSVKRDFSRIFSRLSYEAKNFGNTK